MSDDPSDLLPTPSPAGNNALDSGPSTSPIATSTTGKPPSADLSVGTPPADFVKWVNLALEARLGLTKWGLIPTADKKTLIQKLWQEPSIQTSYVTNHSLLSAGDVSSIALLENQIQSAMMGQGNDPSIAVDYTDMLQAAGVPLSRSEQAALAGATQAVNAPVPQPFGSNAVSGYDYGTPMPAGGWTGTGESFGWDKHYGVDYGTRVGERIVSPYAGTIHVATGVAGYGNIVYVTLDNGYTMGFGHVASAALQNGARVNPGDFIAIAGANVGSAKGSVTIVTLQGPTAEWDKNGVLQGGYENPHEQLDAIFAGTTFAHIGYPGAAGTGMPTVNTVLDSRYPSIKRDWEAYYGTVPSPADVYDVIAHGSSPQQWLDYIRSRPSHIDGLSLGQSHDLRQTADEISMKMLGHPATDGIVKELYDNKQTHPTAVQRWYDEFAVTGMAQETYQQIYKGAQPTMDGIFGEKAGADPRDIKAIHDRQAQARATSGHGTQSV